jgi:hypothetical protein
MSFKEKFKYSNEIKCWIYTPFLISNTQYEKSDWDAVDTIINDFIENQEYYKYEGNSALINYAREIDFFSKEEFDDLDLDFGQVRLLFRHQKLEGLKLTYSVKEDGTQKIHWKDLYGIWVVEFMGRTVSKVDRVSMIDFD